MARRCASGSNNQVKLSKTLTWVLRHGASEVGLKLQDGGFLYVDELLGLKRLSSYTVDDIKTVVANCEKKRFYMETEDSSQKLRIRANQGHTVEVEGLALTPITDAAQFPVVVHGTYHKAWESISSQGLKCMKRTHIHFAPGEPGTDGVISGLRNSCNIVIYINLQKALEDGITFFLSSNKVILSPGDKDGIIHPKYFTEVFQRNPRMKLN